ncbi:MAG: MarR family transcriptional regulator [Pseudomonadota bacterium]
MSIDEKVMMAMVRIAERFKKDSAAVVKKWGLTFSQYNVLRVLDASEDGENTMRNVNRIMLVSSANMTGIAKRLEKSGFIVRKSDPDDDRIKRLQITPMGTEVLKAISDRKERSLREYLTRYSAPQRNALLSTLQDILRQTNGKDRSELTAFEQSSLGESLEDSL